MTPSSGRMQRMLLSMKPWLRARTLKVSMALAMVGVVIFFSASISAGVSGATTPFSCLSALADRSSQAVVDLEFLSHVAQGLDHSRVERDALGPSPSFQIALDLPGDPERAGALRP